MQFSNIESAGSDGETLIEQDQPKQENETAEREINRDLPGRGAAISTAPDSDKQERRDESQFVEGVEEKQIKRSEGTDRAAGDEKQTGIERFFMFLDLTRKPNCRDRDDRRQQHHDQAQAIETKGKREVPFRQNRPRADILESLVARWVESNKCQNRQRERKQGSKQRGFPGGKTERDQKRRDERRKNDEIKHQRKTVK